MFRGPRRLAIGVGHAAQDVLIVRVRRKQCEHAARALGRREDARDGDCAARAFAHAARGARDGGRRPAGGGRLGARGVQVRAETAL